MLGLEVHVELGTATKMFCGCPTAFGARAEHPGLPGLPGAARRDAGDQPDRRRVRHPDRARAELHDRVVVPVRPEELLLPGHAEELPDLAVRRTDRRRRVSGRRRRRGEAVRVEIERAHMEEDTGKSTARRRRDRPDPRRRVLAAGLQPGRRAAGRDRHEDRSSARRPSAPAVARAYVDRAARPAHVARRVRRPDGPGLAALRREPVADARPATRCSAPAPRPRTSTRCARWNAPCATRSPGRRAVLDGRWPGDAGDQALRRVDRHARRRAGRRRPRRTTGTSRSPIWCRSRRTRSGWRRSGAALPELPWLRRARLQTEWGLTDLEMRDLVAADAVELVAATVAAGASPGRGAVVVVVLPGPAGQHAAGVALAELPITPAQLADVIGKVADGTLTTKLARQVVDGVLAGEGEPGRGDRRPRAGRGLRRLVAAEGGRRGAGRRSRTSPTRSGRARCRRSARSSAP